MHGKENKKLDIIPLLNLAYLKVVLYFKYESVLKCGQATGELTLRPRKLSVDSWSSMPAFSAASV